MTERSFNAQQSHLGCWRHKNHVWNRPAGAEPTNCPCMMIVASMTAAIPTACRRRACNSSSGSCTRKWPSQWNGTPQQIQIKTITRSRNQVACRRMQSQNARTVHPAALATDRADEAATHHQQISSKKVALEPRTPKQTRGVQSDKGGVPLHRQKTRRHVTAPAWIPAIQFTYKFCLSSEAWGPQPILLLQFWSRRSTWWKLRMRWKWKCAHETPNDIARQDAYRDQAGRTLSNAADVAGRTMEIANARPLEHIHLRCKKWREHFCAQHRIWWPYHSNQVTPSPSLLVSPHPPLPLSNLDAVDLKTHHGGVVVVVCGVWRYAILSGFIYQTRGADRIWIWTVIPVVDLATSKNNSIHCILMYLISHRKLFLFIQFYLISMSFKSWNWMKFNEENLFNWFVCI